MNKLVTCETCPALILDSLLKVIQTTKGPMKVCKKCFQEHESGTVKNELITNQIPEVFPEQRKKDEAPEVNAFLQSISYVSNPQEVPHPKEPSKKFTQSELFAEYLRDEQLKISDLFKDGHEPFIAYAQLEARIQLLESIVFEAKVRASEATKVKRELDAKSGKNRWDKERRGENKANLVDPRDGHMDSRKGKDKRSILTKVETVVKGMMDIGTEDEEIITMLSSSGKFKGIEIRNAIEKFKVSS
jgi:hypothetical protein